MENFDCWIVKNKWGSFLEWTVATSKRAVIEKIGKEKWSEWRNLGHKIIKVKFMEVA